jgi:release factor glutamine methyltransferase
MKLSELYATVRRAFLSQEDKQTASLLARNIVCHYTGKTPEQILTDREMYVGEAQCEAIGNAAQRILDGEPLAYVLGEWEFYGMTLYVDKNVLIPRDDTCAVTGLAVKQGLFLEKDPRILDLCTGSGCIGLAVANRVKDARVTLADISREAMAVAKKNIVRQHLTGRVSVVQADALGVPPAFLGKFDLIVSNPPYITTKEMTQLDHSVKDYEPHLALHGGDDGLDFYRAISKNWFGHLNEGGMIAFEIGDTQGKAVADILTENGYKNAGIMKDYEGRDRVVTATKL